MFLVKKSHILKKEPYLCRALLQKEPSKLESICIDAATQENYNCVLMGGVVKHVLL